MNLGKIIPTLLMASSIAACSGGKKIELVPAPAEHDLKSHIEINEDGVGNITWFKNTFTPPTIIEITSVTRDAQELIGKTDLKIRINGYGSELFIQQEGPVYICHSCASIFADGSGQHLPIFWIAKPDN